MIGEGFRAPRLKRRLRHGKVAKCGQGKGKAEGGEVQGEKKNWKDCRRKELSIWRK